jgi:hypothetical protein
MTGAPVSLESFGICTPCFADLADDELERLALGSAILTRLELGPRGDQVPNGRQIMRPTKAPLLDGWPGARLRALSFLLGCSGSFAANCFHGNRPF